jgi:hypothetical protein
MKIFIGECIIKKLVKELQDRVKDLKEYVENNS